MPATLANTELDARKCTLESKTYRARFDQDTTTPSMAVVAALAEMTGRIPEEMPPLQTSIDTDALDRLVGGSGAGERTVTFPAGAHTVTVRSEGVVVVRESESDTRGRHR